jgi:hypothetical protein
VSTEKEFAVAHPGFWRTTLPLSESFLRTMNRSLERYLRPVASSVAAARRGLVNEAAFRIFVASVVSGNPVIELESADIETAWARGATHVRTMRQFSRAPIDATPRAAELREAIVLAQRTAVFFEGQAFSKVAVEPTFKGCGWIDESTGDVLADHTLFEIKAGERQFRSVDLHQLLSYCALNFATKSLNITSVGLVNPRAGTFVVFNLDVLCSECAGSSAADVLDEIVQHISEPLGAYAR